MTKAEQSERLEAIEHLRATFKPGDTVCTILRHVSRSGMSRSISVISPDMADVFYWVSRAVGWPIDRNNYGVKVSGCGMDMGFHLIYSLSYVLYPNGFGCIGENREARTSCPSNDHSNGDRDYTPNGGILAGMPQADGVHTHWHKDGGYALRHRWL